MPVTSSVDSKFLKAPITWLCQVAAFSGLLVTGFTFCSFASPLSPALDLFSHFRCQYAILSLVFCLAAYLSKKKRYATIFGVAALANLLVVVPLWFRDLHPMAEAAPHTISLLDMNVLCENHRADLVSKTISHYDADVIVVEELNEELYNGIQPALAKYPYRSHATNFDSWGIGMFSKYPMENVDIDILKLPKEYATGADIKFGDKTISFVGLHTVPKLSPSAVRRDKEIVARLAAHNKNCTHDLIMCGDFNATPWSHFFHEIISTGDFIDSERGFGPQLSWPSIFAPLSIPIDHCLVTPRLRVVKRELGGYMGSDHLPIFLRIALPSS